MPQERDLRERLQACISLHSRLRGVAISLSWVSETDTFTLVAGEVDGRKARFSFRVELFSSGGGVSVGRCMVVVGRELQRGAAGPVSLRIVTQPGQPTPFFCGRWKRGLD